MSDPRRIGDCSDSSMAKSVRIYNPLHNVLSHFDLRLTECLQAGSISCEVLPSRNSEVGGDRVAKAVALATHLRNARRHARSGGTTIVAWPLLGWWDVPLWQNETHKTFIAMHDPEPLARQSGLSPRAAQLAVRITTARWPHVVVMSPEALAVVSHHIDSKRVHLVPHPMSTPLVRDNREPTRTVLVLGQHKPARDIGVMAAMAPLLIARGWKPVVAGRGWPDIPGWRVVKKFLNDDEFQTLLASSAALLLPYQHYFQSGVALRALETGIPVVGRETGFLSEILGSEFPGAVSDWDNPACWAAAIEDATQAAESQLAAANQYSVRGEVEWRELVGGEF